MVSYRHHFGWTNMLLASFCLVSVANVLSWFSWSTYMFADDYQRSLEATASIHGTGVPTMSRFKLQVMKQQEERQKSTNTTPFTSPFCSGCLGPQQFLFNGTNTTCGELIHIYIGESEDSAALVQAGMEVARRHPEHCDRCSTESCPKHEKAYMPYDEAAPPEVNAWTLPISPTLLSTKQVIPPEAFPDQKKYFSDPATNYSQSDPEKVYRWEYNPSILPVNLTDVSFLPVASTIKDKQPVYFYSRRVAILNEAFAGLTEKELGPSGRFKDGRFSQDKERVEFGFMDASFTIVADGVFNYEGGQDYRIFKFDGQVYFSGRTALWPLWVVPREDTQQGTKPAHVWKVFQDVYHPNDAPFQINLGYPWCCVNGCEGKNYNYFKAPLPPGDIDDDGSKEAIWVQTRPVEPTEIQRMAPCRTVVRQLQATNATGHNNTAISRSFVDDRTWKPSFAAIAEPYYWSKRIFNHPITEHRGSACCINMVHPVSGQKLLVGISHQKQTGRRWAKLGGRQYTSNFYATLAEPPFSTVALSGAFCLGHPKPAEAAMNYQAPITRNRNFKFGYRLDCPFITFVSTILENPQNLDTVLIGYGLNDAISRVVEVTKAEILSMLFDPFGP